MKILKNENFRALENLLLFLNRKKVETFKIISKVMFNIDIIMEEGGPEGQSAQGPQKT